jgi:hypothetical protein
MAEFGAKTRRKLGQTGSAVRGTRMSAPQASAFNG